MSNGRNPRKRGIAVSGSWLPVPLPFLRSRACAELSPHGAKLLLDVLAILGPNATRNGDISLTPRMMAIRGWPGRSSLLAAIKELEGHGLLIRTRQGGRLDCTLFALTLFPIDCDTRKLDAGAIGSYTNRDYEAVGLAAPTEERPATWRRIRKTESLAPPRDDLRKSVPPRDKTPAPAPAEMPALSCGFNRSMQRSGYTSQLAS